MAVALSCIVTSPPALDSLAIWSNSSGQRETNRLGLLLVRHLLLLMMKNKDYRLKHVKKANRVYFKTDCSWSCACAVNFDPQMCDLHWFWCILIYFKMDLIDFDWCQLTNMDLYGLRWSSAAEAQPVNAPRQGSALPLTACQINHNVVSNVMLGRKGKKQRQA